MILGKVARDAAPSQGVPRSPSVARAELLSKTARSRIEDELDKAIERKPASEARLAGVLRAIAPLSRHLRASIAEAVSVAVRRGSLSREIYMAGIRAVAEGGDEQASSLVKRALVLDEAGGSSALFAAAICKDPSIAVLLGKIAASRQSHVAFAAETARVVRGESNGALLTSLAPKIKEGHRIALCVELFVPLARATVCASIGLAPALAVVRGAERDLGRWLALASVAARAGDPEPVAEAARKAQDGPTSARAAWSLVHWGLLDTLARHSGQARPAPPKVKPTVELIARLSDRPSSERDMSFMFRLAASGTTTVRPMLESLVRLPNLNDETSLRAASLLARFHERDDLRAALLATASGERNEDQRGLAVAALWDAGARDEALRLAEELIGSRHLASVAWASLVRAAACGVGGENLLVTETHFRWIQLGWLE